MSWPTGVWAIQVTPSSASQLRRQVFPFHISLLDEVHFPFALAFFEQGLAVDSGMNVSEGFEIDEVFDLVLFRKAFDHSFTMLPTAPHQITGDANIKRTITP